MGTGAAVLLGSPLRHGGDLGSVVPQVAVLLGFAAVALALATWRLRRAITS